MKLYPGVPSPYSVDMSRSSVQKAHRDVDDRSLSDVQKHILDSYDTICSTINARKWAKYTNDLC